MKMGHIAMEEEIFHTGCCYITVFNTRESVLSIEL